MIVLGEIKNCSFEKIEIKTKETLFEIQNKLNSTKFNINDNVILQLSDNFQMENYKNQSIDFLTVDNTKITRIPFNYISQIKQNQYCDLIAICTDFKDLIKTKGTDFLFSLNLLDHTGKIELKVFTDEKSFKTLTNNGKETFKKGDILLIRNIKICSNGKYAVVSKPCVISKVKEGESITEDLILSYLKSIWQTKSISSSQKLKSICDIKDRSFFNIIGKVIRCDYEKIPSVCITDYTVNSLVKEESGTFPNNMVLIIKLFGTHSSHLKKVVIGEYYLFENIRIHSFNIVLEAYMHDNLPGNVVLIKENENFSNYKTVVDKIKQNENQYYSNIKKTEVNVDSSENTENRNSFDIRTVSIHCIDDPGVFLCCCLIEDISHSLNKDDLSSIVTVIDSGRIYKIQMKRNLTKKIIENNEIVLKKEYKCLVLKTTENMLFLVDIFLTNEEYLNFVAFYNKSCGINK